MAVSQKITPYKGTDVDNNELNLDSLKAVFIKNFVSEVNDNGRTGGDGQNAYAFTPIESNEPYTNGITLPNGKNYCCGYYYSKELNQALVWVWNSIGKHFIYRLQGDSGLAEMVIQDACLDHVLDPQYFISEGRCVVQIMTRLNKISGLHQQVAIWIYTDNRGDQRMISPDDLVATGGFNPTQFPYFNLADTFSQRCDLFKLGRPTPMGCIQVTPVARNLDNAAEKNKNNLLNYKGWQFRVKTIDQYGRSSEHGIISDTYFNQIGNSCLASSSGLPRCLRLKFPAGDPLTNQIQISFRNCIGSELAPATDSDWYKFTLFNKYNDCETNEWWTRTVSNPWKVEYDRLISTGATVQAAEEGAYALGLTRYWPAENMFEYTFCADKEHTPIPVAETNRFENPLPLTSSTVFPLNKSIAFARDKRGFEPMDCNELAKIKFGTTTPSVSSCSKVPFRKVTIWGVIWNPNTESKVRIRKDGSDIMFGIADCSNNNPRAFDQILPKDQEGIIGHLAGTDYYAISKQHRYDAATDTDEYQGLNYTSGTNPFDVGRYVAIQKWEFNVLPGKYRFQISSHKSTPTDDYKSTSTYFIGRTSLTNVGQLVEEQRELIIDVCAADYELKSTPLMIWDLTNVGKNCTTSSAAASVVTGYMLEDEVEKKPIERAVLQTNHDGDVFKCSYTDHNGFYFASRRGRTLQATIRGYKNCVSNQVLATGRTTRDTADNWYKFDTLYAYKNETAYPAKDRMLIKGKVTLCGNPTIGLPGVVINLTRGGYAVTNANGEYTIVMHDSGDGGSRSEKLIIGQRGTCQILACQDQCTFCFSDLPVSGIACNGQPRTINVATITARINVVNQKGPKMGGRYGVGVFMYDWMGRRSFVQGNETHYVDIASLQQTQTYEFSKITFNLNNAKFPSWVRRITFAVTSNLNWDDDLTWVMERVQFIDNTGKQNTSAPTQIRLYYESLNEYNKQNDFSTNSTWEFLTSENNSVNGDMIEFLANADGTIFDKKITALARYNKEGKYIQIDYTEDLKGLKDGTLVRLIRPTQRENKQFYYEVCPSIEMLGNTSVAAVQTGTINYFDSYLLYRQIPVPRLIVTTGTNDDGDEIETSVTDNQITPYPFFYEHHSPADTWGNHCANRGRIGVKNPQEKQRLIRTEIAVSNALVNDGQLNGLHYFEEKDMIVLDEQEWGGITTCLPEINTILVICEYDNFVIAYNDNSVVLDANGQLSAPSGERRFGRPQRKTGNNFGCQLRDINTIRKKDGIVMWLDTSKSAIVSHNYSEGTDITPGTENKGGYKSYVTSLVKQVLEFNTVPDAPRKFFHATIDPKTNEYLLTVTNIEQTEDSYVNHEREIVIGSSNTIGIHIYTNVMRHWGYTPEYMGSMEGHKDDQQLITFKGGMAWRHHRTKNPKQFGNIFGEDVDTILEVVYNIDQQKVKAFMWTEVYCHTPYYVDRVQTESGQISRIMPRFWEKINKFYAAAFLCATNTQSDANIVKQTTENALLDGDHLYGRWARVRYVNTASTRNVYRELSSVVGFVNPVERSGDK